ncbi:efflux RND transporter permease subunit [Phenylobacterium montanum]|uniref:Efflux pump membrane transporter n=1 Tax=Phenylobacterium montanum TaxID=2823693 RepID=A0A975G000_9CAUL|nr:multidrug efflux RND transporter permease subunit [Caulobacter sp. S6]QUD88074.1 efflux RND transporter permease subunit [Caulobacter sp. S6]
MKLSHFFIERPVFAAVVAILITLVGAIAYPSLPVAQYPNIAPPTVVVSATYPGASAETLADAVATPIEEQINGVEDMLYMSSQSTGDGHVNITVTFKLGTDPNNAQVLVENRVATATPHLPAEVVASGVTVRKASTDFLLAVHMYSPDGSLDQQYIANYVGLHIRDALLRVPGVGDIGSRAARDYSMRIWIDPDRAAARNLTVDDVVAALRSHNVQVAAGAIGAPPLNREGSAYQLNVETLGRLMTPQQFGDIVIKSDLLGRVTKVTDVARIELGAADYTTNAYMNKYNAVALGILQQPGTNALQTADAIVAQMNTLKRDFPPGLDYKIIYNPTDYVRASIDEVEKTLFEALALVVVVVMIFLQSWRAAVIPIIAIPVSLIGTFAVMGAFGFSLNTLSLFGLVLAIGIVVDDAIVVVENVERLLHLGMTPREAAHQTMDEVGGALVAIALVLTAVFVPTAFISGISGQFYKQFALTIATATVFSLIISLTLSPALAALIMKPHAAPKAGVKLGLLTRFGQKFNAGFDALSGRYSRLVRRLVRLVAVMLLLYAGLLGLTGWRLTATPTGFIPTQDQGQLLVAVNLPPGASLGRTDAIMHQVRDILLGTPGVEAASIYAGVDATSGTTSSDSGQIYLMLKPFPERYRKHQETPKVMAELKKRLSVINGAEIKLIVPPSVRGIGTTGGFKLIVEDQGGHSYQQLEATTRDLAEATKSEPAIGSAFVTFNTRTPRMYADIDRTKAEMLGVPDASIFDTLQTYLGSTYINDFNLFGHTFQVLAQADAPYRNDISRLPELQTRSNTGAMVPLGSVVNLKPITGPYRVLRYNLFPAAEINGDAAPGYSSGQAMAAMERLARERLPAGYNVEWTELAYQQKLAGNTGGVVFVLAVVFVFLLLAALYESVTLPLAVILIVPMCLLAAMLGVNLRGMDNNILTQIGLVVLIGLAAKNAILIVEFARQGELEHGLESHDAAVEAGRTRLRPILMTSAAFILGVFPLAFATGAGAEMRQALGVAVFFGMIGVTVFGLMFTPVFYVACRWISHRLPQPPRKRPAVPTTSGTPHETELAEEG